MTIYDCFDYVNREVLALPTTVLFLATALYFSLYTGFKQIRAFPHFIRLLIYGVHQDNKDPQYRMSAWAALFTAMATTIGMGNVVGPSVAIMSGGPGALFWLLVYMLLGSVIKYVEVLFAIRTRIQYLDGRVIGGPMVYLRQIGTWLGNWYTVLIMVLLISWSSVQANTLAHIFAQEGIPQWATGFILALLVYHVVIGGALRIGNVASMLVPVMFVCYMIFATIILLQHPGAIWASIVLVVQHIFKPAAAAGGFLGATVLMAMRHGTYRGILITEAGVGTSSIPHAIAETQNPEDQAILAMCSTIADGFLSIISGLLVLVTGLWMQGCWRTTIMYELFRDYSPLMGKQILLIAVTLFVVTTVIGNTFNGLQSVRSLIRGAPWVPSYIAVTLFAIVIGACVSMPTTWAIMDTILALVAVPNLVGLVILSITHTEWLRSTK